MEDSFRVRGRDSRLSPEDLIKIERHPIHVVLDNLRSAFNVGSIFRTADAALVERLHLCGITAYPPHQKLDKTAMGALDYVPWEHHPDTRDAVLSLKDRGMPIVCLEPRLSRPGQRGARNIAGCAPPRRPPGTHPHARLQEFDQCGHCIRGGRLRGGQAVPGRTMLERDAPPAGAKKNAPTASSTAQE